MARHATTTLVGELLSEFVEDQVRRAPRQPFGMGDLKQALTGMLGEAGILIELRPADDPWISAWLDQHPLLQRQPAGTGTWKPGLNRALLRRA
jgi:hypothetical protein